MRKAIRNRDKARALREARSNRRRDVTARERAEYQAGHHHRDRIRHLLRHATRDQIKVLYSYPRRVEKLHRAVLADDKRCPGHIRLRLVA